MPLNGTDQSAAPVLLLADPVPGPVSVRELASTSQVFSISHDGAYSSDLFELLCNGLTFDLGGWQGAPDRGEIVQGFDIEIARTKSLLPLALRPGLHITGGAGMLPVVKAMMRVAGELLNLEGIRAVQWQPAGSAMSADYFRRAVMPWLTGGVFPGLGLVSLAETERGSIQTIGMNYFGNQELQFDLDQHPDKAETAKLAVRLIDAIVGQERVEGERTVQLEADRFVLLSATPGTGIIRVLR